MKATKILEDFNRTLAGMSYPSEPEGLYEPIAYVLKMGGKRLRPVFMLLTYSVFQEDYMDIMPAAIGLETYHNYTLLHDDLMDNADIRRGMATVHRRWDANTAILSGDEMLVLACREILGTKNEHTWRAMEVFLKTAIEVGEGQQMDMNFEKRTDVTEEEYVEMIRLKTSVLVACAVKMGAILGGAEEESCKRLAQFGESVGLAFQLQDDLLDAYGTTEVFGKRKGGDILQNKKTWLLINAFERADECNRKELNRWLSANDADPDEKVGAVIEIYDKLGVAEACNERIDHYFNQAQWQLNEVGLPREGREELWAFAESLCGRES